MAIETVAMGFILFVIFACGVAYVMTHVNEIEGKIVNLETSIKALFEKK